MAQIQRLIEKVVLNPNIVGTLHLLLTRAPEKIRGPLLAHLQSRFSEQTVQHIITVLKWLTVVAWTKRINHKLNTWALNNWVWSAQTDKWIWSWEVAVVTGGSSGIGKEIVKGLVAKGVKVAVLDIQPLPVDLVNEKKVTFIQCDITSLSSITEAAKTVRKNVGEVSILINNAGVGKPHSILDTPSDWVTKIFQINVISHFHLAKEFLPHMIKKNKGHIVGLASMASFVCPPSIVDYGATKAGVLAFHEGLSQELKHIYKTPGVLNTVVHPYWAATPLVGGYEAHLEKTQGKLLKPETIARKVCDQIFSARGGQLIIPSAMNGAPGLRGFPNWLQELIRDRLVGKAGAQFPQAQVVTTAGPGK